MHDKAMAMIHGLVVKIICHVDSIEAVSLFGEPFSGLVGRVEMAATGIYTTPHNPMADSSHSPVPSDSFYADFNYSLVPFRVWDAYIHA